MATKDRTALKNDFANGKYATGEKFADLIDSMKVVQLPVVDPQALGTSLSFIDSISQDADGKITVTKKTVQPTMGSFRFVANDATAEAALTTYGATYSSAISGVSPSADTTGVILLMNDDDTTPTKTMMIATQSDGNNGYQFVYVGDIDNAVPSGVLTQGDIADNLNTDDATKVLSAKRGKIIGDEVFGYNEEVEQAITEGIIDGAYYSTHSDQMPNGYTSNSNTTKDSCLRLQVAEGDKFKLSTKGNNDYVRGWVFADSGRNKILQDPNATTSTVYTDVLLTAPQGAYYLYINTTDKANYPISLKKIIIIHQDGLSDKVGGLQEDMVSVQGDVVGLEEDVIRLDNSNQYSKAVEGVEYVGDYLHNADVKNIIKSVCLVKYSEDYVIPDNLYIRILQNNSTQFRMVVYDEENNAVFTSITYPTRPKITQKAIVPLIGDPSSTYYKKAILLITLDFTVYTEDLFWGSPSSGVLTENKIDVWFDATKLNQKPLDDSTINQQVVTLSNPWKGKTVVAFGDSITEYKDDLELGYCDYAQMMSGANIINVAVGGTRFYQRTTPNINPTSSNEGYAGMDIINMVRAAANLNFDGSNTYREIVEACCNYIKNNAGDDNTLQIERLFAVDWTKVDAVTFLGGANDWGSGGLGTSGTKNDNTTLGAINLIIDTLLTAYPWLKIYWFTLTPRYVSNVRDSEHWSDNYSYYGITAKQFAEAVFNEVTLNKIPICDLYNTLGWNQYNFSQYFRDNDGVHPYKGFNFIAKKYVGFISSMGTL